MADMPNFRVNNLGSLLEELYRFYQRLGYHVAIAYTRTHGDCACGNSGCRLDPHILDDQQLDLMYTTRAADSCHLVMATQFSLATEDVRVLGYLTDSQNVPILRHGGTTYLFVREAGEFADLFPILGKSPNPWLSLPPHRCDTPSGGFELPTWLFPLSTSPDQLPRIEDIFKPSVFEHITALRQMRVQLEMRAGQGVLPLDQIVAWAVSDLDNLAEARLALTAAVTIGGLVDVDQAQRLLDEDADALRTAILQMLFADQVFETDELVEVLYNVALSMIDLDDEVTIDAGDGIDLDDVESDIDSNPYVSTPNTDDPESIASDAQVYLDELIVSSQWDSPQDESQNLLAGESNALNWGRILDGTDLSALTSFNLFLVVRDAVELERDQLTSLALLDMMLTMVGSPTGELTQLLTYLWPTRQRFFEDLEHHSVVVQLLAGALIRFEIMCRAGILMPDPNALERLLGGDAPLLISDLFGAPDIVLWLQHHVFSAPMSQIASRIYQVSQVLEITNNQIMSDVTTAHYQRLLEGRF
jgi:hypothetical protein